VQPEPAPTVLTLAVAAFVLVLVVAAGWSAFRLWYERAVRRAEQEADDELARQARYEEQLVKIGELDAHRARLQARRDADEYGEAGL
jgi:Tfp pilus assembly protein PilO